MKRHWVFTEPLVCAGQIYNRKYFCSLNSFQRLLILFWKSPTVSWHVFKVMEYNGDRIEKHFKLKGDLKMSELLCHGFQKTHCSKIGSSSGNIIHFLMERWRENRIHSGRKCFLPHYFFIYFNLIPIYCK